MCGGEVSRLCLIAQWAYSALLGLPTSLPGRKPRHLQSLSLGDPRAASCLSPSWVPMAAWGGEAVWNTKLNPKTECQAIKKIPAI